MDGASSDERFSNLGPIENAMVMAAPTQIKVPKILAMQLFSLMFTLSCLPIKPNKVQKS